MRDIMLVISIIVFSPNSEASCSRWETLGGTYPFIANGESSSAMEMQQSRKAVQNYIDHLNDILARCRLSDYDHNQLVDDMHIVANRINRQLILFNTPSLYKDSANTTSNTTN